MRKPRTNSWRPRIYQKALDSDHPPTTPSPKPDYAATVNLYRHLLVEFPNYAARRTYYLLGFCLGEMGQDAEGKQALLAWCAATLRPLDPPPPRPGHRHEPGSAA